MPIVDEEYIASLFCFATPTFYNSGSQRFMKGVIWILHILLENFLLNRTYTGNGYLYFPTVIARVRMQEFENSERAK